MIPTRAPWRPRLLAVLGCVAINATALGAQAGQESELAVIPRPVSMTRAAGQFTITPATAVWTDRATAGVGRMLARYLEPATGLALAVRTGASTSGSRIVLRSDPELAKTLGAEGYRLVVRPGRITVTASDAAGAFYAVQTIRQLLPPEIFREAKVDGVIWTVPAVTIEDRPRFQWRGAHLDVSRHFMPREFVKKYIDLLALHKMNSFHWHLTDDQGWRIQIKRYPLLTEIGGWRPETLVGRNRDTAQVFDKTRHGGFYTQDDVREVVAYARERFVNVVPEIEMPGHAQAAITAYPRLGNFPDSVQSGVWTRWGVSKNIFNPSDSTIAFLQDVLSEVLTLFPGKYIHIGGDEAVKDQWKASPFAQQRIRDLGLKNEEELQSWFIRQMDTFLTARGRRLIGWDEILEGGLAPNAVVMSWRGTEGGIAAARQRHDVVMTPGKPTYLDHYQALNRESEPLAIGGFNPVDSVYLYDPVPAELEPEFAKHILGTQGQIWTEYIHGPKNVEYMAYPRLTALSEASWTPSDRKDLADFMGRLATHVKRLDALDVAYRPLTPSVVP